MHKVRLMVIDWEALAGCAVLQPLLPWNLGIRTEVHHVLLRVWSSVLLISGLVLRVPATRGALWPWAWWLLLLLLLLLQQFLGYECLLWVASGWYVLPPPSPPQIDRGVPSGICLGGRRSGISVRLLVRTRLAIFVLGPVMVVVRRLNRWVMGLDTSATAHTWVTSWLWLLRASLILLDFFCVNWSRIGMSALLKDIQI